MSRKTVSAIILSLLVISALALASTVKPAKSDYVSTETIYIMADGSIQPSTAPISNVDNLTYTLTDNIVGNVTGGSSVIVIQRDNIILDGAGHTLQGTTTVGSTGMELTGISNVTVTNTNIESFEYGIWGPSSSNNTFSGNDITANACINLDSSYGNRISGNNVTNIGGWGINLDSSSNNTVSENNITNIYTGVPWEPWIGIWLTGSSFNTVSENNITNEIQGISLMPSTASTADGSSFNTVSENNFKDNDYGIVLGIWWTDYITVGNCSNNAIYHNNFIDDYQQVLSGNSANAWDEGYSSGGNYWSDYNGTDANHDGIGDTPYVIDANNTDHYPLMEPYVNMVGDVNADGKIDMRDIGYVARRFMCLPGDPLWDSAVDFNGDGKIDMMDISTVARHFGDCESKIQGTQDSLTILAWSDASYSFGSSKWMFLYEPSFGSSFEGNFSFPFPYFSINPSEAERLHGQPVLTTACITMGQSGEEGRMLIATSGASYTWNELEITVSEANPAYVVLLFKPLS